MGIAFVGSALEFEYTGVKGWWTTEAYLDGPDDHAATAPCLQAFGGRTDSDCFAASTGSIRCSMSSLRISTEPTKVLLEIVNHDGKGRSYLPEWRCADRKKKREKIESQADPQQLF